MRFKPSMRFCVLAVFSALVLGCSGGGTETQGGAASTVRTFYDHLNAGQYDDAKALYTDDVRGQIFPDSDADEGFREWADLETHERTLKDFTVVNETDAEGGTTIEFELLFKGGERKQRRVTVSQENGDWRLGFIG